MARVSSMIPRILFLISVVVLSCVQAVGTSSEYPVFPYVMNLDGIVHSFIHVATQNQ